MEWNFHIQLTKYARYIFVSSPLQLFCSIAVEFCLHISWCLGKKPIHKKMPFDISSNFLALMSNLASSLIFIDLLSNVSPVKIWRGGSTRTSWHTWSMRFAVMLRKWLCFNVRNHPFWMINCVEDQILLYNYTNLVSAIMAIHIASSRDPKILVSINYILLLLVV